MAILITDEKGNNQHFDTIEEFERAMIFMARLNGQDVPQALIDEVKAVNENAEEEETVPKILAKKDEEESVLKFKAGDKVRVQSADYHYLEDGEVGTVTGIDKFDTHCTEGGRVHTPYTVKTESHPTSGQSIAEHHLTAVEDELRFKVGDKVKVIANYSSGYDVGTVGVIESFDDSKWNYDYQVSAPGPFDTLGHRDDELELVEEEADFRDGDVVVVTETFRDGFGDSALEGSKYIVHERGGYVIGVGDVLIGDNVDKLRLVCRKEDRKDL